MNSQNFQQLDIGGIQVTYDTLVAALLEGKSRSFGGLNVTELKIIASMYGIHNASKLNRGDLCACLKIQLFGQPPVPEVPVPVPDQSQTPRPIPRPRLRPVPLSKPIPMPRQYTVSEEDKLLYMGLMSKIQFSMLSLRTPDAPVSRAGSLVRYHKQLHNDITSMCSFGSTIMVRTFENNLSYLEFIIVGPHGTPYQNGFFHFTMDLPPGFPRSPPKVSLVNTGGSKVRHNPNLYSNGYVCLSIINTWKGEGWSPNKKLSDVMIGIQSHIFNEDPWLNEPGHANNAATCKAYNHIIRLSTMIDGMLRVMENPPQHFMDAVIMHFYGPKRPEILNQIKVWEADLATLDVRNILPYMTSQTYYCSNIPALHSRTVKDIEGAYDRVLL